MCDESFAWRLPINLDIATSFSAWKWQCSAEILIKSKRKKRDLNKNLNWFSSAPRHFVLCSAISYTRPPHFIGVSFRRWIAANRVCLVSQHHQYLFIHRCNSWYVRAWYRRGGRNRGKRLGFYAKIMYRIIINVTCVRWLPFFISVCAWFCRVSSKTNIDCSKLLFCLVGLKLDVNYTTNTHTHTHRPVWETDAVYYRCDYKSAIYSQFDMHSPEVANKLAATMIRTCARIRTIFLVSYFPLGFFVWFSL